MDPLLLRARRSRIGGAAFVGARAGACAGKEKSDPTPFAPHVTRDSAPVDNRVNNSCGKGCEYPCCSPDQGGLGRTLAPWERRAAEPELGRRAGMGMVADPPADVHRSPIPPPFRWRGPPWIPRIQRGPRPHSFGHTVPMVRPAGFGAGERGDVASCMEARNAPWPAGDGLDGAEAVACIAGEPLRCGGGRAVHLRFRDPWLPQVCLE
ncbi:MAG: hypothetical protein QOH19_2452 [Actinomycetota bacterium]|jgi:hypothetical protein|nr:hypothetical protein [Actinomycetota bacterium]